MKLEEVRAAQAGAMTERELETRVGDLCAHFKVRRFHHLDSRGTTAGWVDDVILGPRGVLFRELKTQRGRITGAQLVVQGLLRAAGLDVGVWRPSDLFYGVVRREIESIS